MLKDGIARRVVLAAVAAALVGEMAACAPFRQYRDVYDVCASPDVTPPPGCDRSALQQISDGHGGNYLMGFVEFDDQGLLWDRGQMHALEDQLADAVGKEDLLMVVFAHGWKHNADPSDPNIRMFRGVLADLSAAEARLSAPTALPARRVVGVYLAWRGASLPVLGIENLTFWDRKNTAQKVGHGGVTEILSRLEHIRQLRDAVAPGSNRTRLVVVGHSFGGAVVATALSQILADRFIETAAPAGTDGDVAGFGNLVVLINPAFEAVLFSPLNDMAAERGRYFESQLPVLAVLTSEADWATGIAFPLGRWVSTAFERVRLMKRFNATTKQFEIVDEGDANLTAVGHFTPYRTHWLYPSDTRKREEVVKASPDETVRRFLRSSADWVHDVPRSKISFDGLILERTPTSAGRNPYLVVRVDKRLIPDHNEINDPRVVDFVKQLILISTHSSGETEQLRRATASQ